MPEEFDFHSRDVNVAFETFGNYKNLYIRSTTFRSGQWL